MLISQYILGFNFELSIANKCKSMIINYVLFKFNKYKHLAISYAIEESCPYQRTDTDNFRSKVYIFIPFGRFLSLTDSPGRPIMTWSAIKLPVELRSLAELRI